MSAPSLYRFKTHTATGTKFWASVHYLGRMIESTPRFNTRAEAQAFARAIIRVERAKGGR